jgi:hypothetical protein
VKPQFLVSEETLNGDARDDRLSMRFKAEELALCEPIQRQARIVHQTVGTEMRRVPPVQDLRDNVGG